MLPGLDGSLCFVGLLFSVGLLLCQVLRGNLQLGTSQEAGGEEFSFSDE